MTPTWLKALKHLHLVIITRELRAVLTVVCELDDEVGGRWRRRLWVGR